MSAPETPALPDPKEIAKTYAEVAQRASNLITAHTKRQMKKGISAPADELGIAQAFMDMKAQMLANPYKLAQAQILRALETTWRNWRAFIAEKKDELTQRQTSSSSPT